jgi:DNA-binding NarL/FixJ family response regulator
VTGLSDGHSSPRQQTGLPDAGAASGSGLLGRERELGLVAAFLDRVRAEGGALLVVGDTGAGKSALLDAAERMASAAGFGVLRAGGTEFEMRLRFTALNQVLLPLREQLERISPACRDALEVALGFRAGPPPDTLAVSNAVLELLGRATARRPVLVIVDDLPWIDRPSAAVLGFVARRLVGSRVGFLGALRSGQESFFERAGLPELDVGPLDERSSTALLCSRFPLLAEGARERLLAEARGNPLALLELPAALSPSQLSDDAALPDRLPLSRRLQGLFAARVRDLPSRTRRVLLRAALDGTGELAVLASAPELEDLAAAERARLVSVVGSPRRVEFRHPLTRSAVVDLATESERRAAHRELAEIWRDRPDRRAWHLAEAATGPDAEVAALLEQSARRVLRRGDAARAIAALTRAAEMSADAASQGRRLAEAAYIGAEGAGELGSASALLTSAQVSDPGLGGSLHAAAATAMLLLNGDGDLTTAHRLLAAAVGNAESGDAYDSGLIEALYTLAVISFLGGRPELWEPVYRELDQLRPLPKALSVIAKTFSDPARTGKAALDDFEALASAMDRESDPATINRIATAALFIDRVGRTRPATWRVITQGRRGGLARRHLSGLIHLCLDDFHTGQWEEAGQLAEEGLAVCAEHGYRFLTWYFQYTQALLAAVRGDQAASRALADQVIGWAVPRGVHGAETLVRHALVLSAAGSGDFEDAYRQATAISPAGELASHVPGALWVAFDLVEAAARTSRLDEARAHVAAMTDADMAAISPRLALLQHGAAALTVSGIEATRRFDQALAVPAAACWQFDHARVQLAYGEHLRRNRATTEAREQLAASLETFERVGAAPWAARAARELRASGQTRPRTRKLTSDPLTPQEHKIAALAAAGLSNKQIAQRLFLSPKTVSNHLFRIFPKLGITSRAALRDVLATIPAGQTVR